MSPAPVLGRFSLWGLFGLFVAWGCLSVGCAPVRPRQAEAIVSQLQHELLVLEAWRLEGRVAIQTAQEGITANLFWEHDRHQDRVRLSGPFSQGAVSIVLQGDLIYVNEGHGSVQLSREPEEFLRQRLGFAIPLRRLRYWILGLPAPGDVSVVMEKNEAGVRFFNQEGYALTYERFAQVGGFALPQKMIAQSAAFKLKLIVDEWVLN